MSEKPDVDGRGQARTTGRRSALRGMAGIGVSALAGSIAGACVSGRPPAQAQDPDGQTANATNMVGKLLRVYHSGDALTLDYNPERVNIELGPVERIVAVSFG